MEITVEKGKTLMIGKDFIKCTYILTADGDPASKRYELETIIDKWLEEWETKIRSESIGNDGPQKNRDGRCKDCGKPCDSRYEKCFNCYRKSQA